MQITGLGLEAGVQIDKEWVALARHHLEHIFLHGNAVELITAQNLKVSH